MKIWIDAQLPPTLANWLTDNFNLEAVALRDIQLRDAQDTEIFESAQAEKAVIMTKDSDFIDLVCRLGSPPQILWLTCGNVTNRNLRQLLTATLYHFFKVMTDLIKQGKLINYDVRIQV